MLMRSCFAGFVVVVCAGGAMAAPLNLDLQNTPDILSQFIDVTYSAESDALRAEGFALTIDTMGGGPGTATPINNGTFAINATVDAEGFATGGTLEIRGVVAGRGGPSNLLLSGNLVAFGFVEGVRGLNPDTLEFLFDVTGGSLADLFGAQAGVILGASGFTGSFVNDWNNNSGIPGLGAAVADTAPPVPAPFGVSVGLAGLALAATRRRRA